MFAKILAKIIDAKKNELPLPPEFDLVLEHTKNHNTKKEIIRVLHAALEYGMPSDPSAVAVGGIGSMLASLVGAQNQHHALTDARVIMPYYPILHAHVAVTKVAVVQHYFVDLVVTSEILATTTSSGIIIYLVKEQSNCADLFGKITHASYIYSNVEGSAFIQRTGYFSGAVVAMAIYGGACMSQSFIPNVLQGHSWGLGYLGALLQQYRNIYNHGNTCGPSTLFTVHSVHAGDGWYDYTEVPYIGVAKTHTKISMTEIIVSGYDHLTYVSEQLLRDTLTSSKWLSNKVFSLQQVGKVSSILNNIHTDQFDPCLALPAEYSFHPETIADGKRRLKHKLNQLLAHSMKLIKLDQPLVLYLGRLSAEKGIDKLEQAIELVLANGGSFVVMGVGWHPIIEALQQKYVDYNNVILLTTQAEQQAYGQLIRYAADIYFVPSNFEACGLVPMEGNISGAIVVANKVGGLQDVVKPDANGGLFNGPTDLHTTLAAVCNSWQEMAAVGNLNKVMQCIRESAKATFDWQAKVGSVALYLQLYKQLNNPIQLVATGRLMVLHMCFEYKKTKLGGVGETITAICEATNRKTNTTNIEAQVIMPHLPWHDVLISQEKLLDAKQVCQIRHRYLEQIIVSQVTVVNNDGTVQYLVKPVPGQLTAKEESLLFVEVVENKAEKIFHEFTPKVAYFNSAVAAFVACSNVVTKQIAILSAHGWGCSLVACLLKPNALLWQQAPEINNLPVITLTVHSEFSEQGVVTAGHPHLPYLRAIGLDINVQLDFSLLRVGLLIADQVIYVSMELAKQAKVHGGCYGLHDVCTELERNGKSIAILNGISRAFEPNNLGVMDQASLGGCKYKAKLELNTMLSKNGKQLDPEQPLVMFVGRFLHEKGINNLAAAIEATVAAGGNFVVMGIYGGSIEDQEIKNLAEKYNSNSRVIILHEASYQLQRKYGALIRFAADITFIPSHRESCGLVSMEAQLNASFVVSSNVGGLNDTVKPTITGFMYQNGHEGVIAGRRNTLEVKAAIFHALKFLRELKQDPEQYNNKIQAIYAAACRNYILEGEDGSLAKYLQLYNKMIYNQILKDNLLVNDLSGFPHSLLKTQHGDIIAVCANIGNGLLSKVFVGKVVYSNKYHQAVDKQVVIKRVYCATSASAAMVRNEKQCLRQHNLLVLPYLSTDPKNINIKYIFMELLGNKTLRAALSATGVNKLTIRDKIDIMLQLFQQLEALHAAGMLHLDLHSGNVVLTDGAKYIARLIDLANVVIAPDDELVAIDGWMAHAPAEAFGFKAGKKTDIYCLAAIFAEMLAGELNLDLALFQASGGMGYLAKDRRAEVLAKCKIEVHGDELLMLRQMQNLMVAMLAEKYNDRPNLAACIAWLQQDVQHTATTVYPVVTTITAQDYCRTLAATSRFIKIWQFLYVNKFPDVMPDTLNEVKHTAITAAVNANKLDILQLLLEFSQLVQVLLPKQIKENPIDQLNGVGYSALHVAVLNKNVAMVQFLLSQNVLLCQTDLSGNTAYDLSKKLGASGKKIKALIFTKSQQAAMSTAYSYKKQQKPGHNLLQVLVFLHQHGFVAALRGLNSINSLGHTPLTLAANLADDVMLTLLIKLGAGINVYNGCGNLPLHLAVDKADAGIIRELMLHGARPEYTNDYGLSAVDLALNHGFTEIYNLLLQAQVMEQGKKITWMATRKAYQPVVNADEQDQATPKSRSLLAVETARASI